MDGIEQMFKCMILFERIDLDSTFPDGLSSYLSKQKVELAL